MELTIYRSTRNADPGSLVLAASERLRSAADPTDQDGHDRGTTRAGLGARAVGAMASTALIVVAAGSLAPSLFGTSVSAGAPARCAPIGWVLNPQHGSVDALGDLAQAFEVLGSATHLRFVYEGLTPLSPTDRLPPSGPEIVVAWADTDEIWRGRAVARGLGLWEGADGERRLLRGWVALKAPSSLNRGSGPGPSIGRVVLHELGHVMGLNHSTDPTDLMYPSIDAGSGLYSGSERDLLAAIGRRAGCDG